MGLSSDSSAVFVHLSAFWENGLQFFPFLDIPIMHFESVAVCDSRGKVFVIINRQDLKWPIVQYFQCNLQFVRTLLHVNKRHKNVS